MAPHPRLWITPAILATLKARAARGTDRWRALKALADRPSQTWDVGLISYALVYLVTGDPSYAAKAWALMSESMAAGLGQISRDQYYDTRSYFPAAAATYDWLDGWMSPAQRGQLQADLLTNSRAVWPETAPSRAGAWGVDNPGNNYYHGFLMTWLAGLALGDDPTINLALKKWTTEVTPYLNGPAAGGCLYEGTSYSVDSLSFMLLNTVAHFTSTGTSLGTPWLNQALQFLAHLTTPEMDEVARWGDQTKDSPQDARRLPFLIGAAQGMPWARTWLDNAVPPLMQSRGNAWQEFLWYPEETPGVDYRLTWPGFAAAQGPGVVSSRSSWGPGAVQVAISAGATRESHQDRASGAFALHAGGEWLLGWDKMTRHSGIAQDTDASCCVTIGGARQTWTQADVTQGRIEDTPAYTTLAADLTGAYAGQCSSYVREYLFLKPGTLFVRDTLAGVPAGVAVMSYLHTGRLKPELNALGFRVRGQAAQLFGIAVQPDMPAFTITTLTVDRDPGVVGYRLDAADQALRAYLMCFEAAPLDQVGGNWRDWEVMGMVGAVSPGALVAWPKMAAPWAYFAPATSKHLIMGATPGQAYTVNGNPLTASPGGVLMFDAPPAGTKVTIQVADSGGGGGGGDLTRRTWAVQPGSNIITASGETIQLSGGTLVVTAIPGADPGEAPAPKPPRKEK